MKKDVKPIHMLAIRWSLVIFGCAAFGQAFAQGSSVEYTRAMALVGKSAAVTEIDDRTADMEDLPGRYGPPAGVKKITDGALSCQEIYDEAKQLQQMTQDKKAAVAAAQKEANAARDKMMDQSTRSSIAGSVGSSIASSLLGMIPGGGLISNAAMQASVNSRQSAIQDSVKGMMDSQQKAMEIHQELAYAEARHDHLVSLFLKKSCTPIR